ncbi:hypothetical protein [Nostoc sp. UHCC 0870]|uniref:hypothetical protein n=1 Tax=Nostoc sp. UHCC 0870 TaxID=2914041 RepID=UPI001EE0DA09|nr:hypothetical protein [Nostoc sp. UHCC 0870]UKP01031.1 hypothetical protein L6494_28190 [Nostoc sp. UHCC 0870]UKP01202.1 hypothetical protein L6494_29100 [Nostoc sp. UHCC 0870]
MSDTRELKPLNDGLQKIELWNDWSDIFLSTPEERIERLEVLLCQKVYRGEDISQCLTALEYIQNRVTEQKLEPIVLKRVQFKLTVTSWYKVSQTLLALLIVITCFGSLLMLLTSPPSSLPQITKPHSPIQIPKKN